MSESSVESRRWLVGFSDRPAEARTVESSAPEAGAVSRFDPLNRLLACIVTGFVTLDTLWVTGGHYHIDAAAYSLLTLFSVLCIIGAVFYGRVRNEPSLSAMFAATAFLMIFPAACCLLSYLCITITGPRIDMYLLAIDRSLGFDWPALMAFFARHNFLIPPLGWAYESIIWQTLVLVVLLGLDRKPEQLYGFCIAIALGATVTLTVWTAFPSFGAYSVYELPHAVATNLRLPEILAYGHQLSTLLLGKDPGFISPRNLRGIVGFPSYHTVQALALIWYARKLPYVRWAFLALNAAVIAATPVYGGHHAVDIAAGALVAALAIAGADWAVKKLSSERPDIRAVSATQSFESAAA